MKTCGSINPQDCFSYHVGIVKQGRAGSQRQFTLILYFDFEPFSMKLLTKCENRIDTLNATGRSLTDRMAVLDTRGTGPIESRLKWIEMEDFSGINGDGSITMHGLDVRPLANSDKVRVLLVNHRPSVDPVTGEYLDSAKIGANSTIEVFEMSLHGNSMKHVKTYANEVIRTPNRAQWVDDNSFVFTNDHDNKCGPVRASVLF